MKKHKQDTEGPKPEMVARVKDKIVTELRKDELLRFCIDILVIVFFVVAILGFVIYR